MSSKRPLSRRTKEKKGKKIPNRTKEEVIQLKECGVSLKEICNKTNLGMGSVDNILYKWAPNNPDKVKKARAVAFEKIALQLSDKAMEALNHITPDSMTHDRVVHKNKDGQVIGVSHSGSSALQLATTAGILRDHSYKALDRAELLRGDAPNVLGPGDVAALLASIKGRITRITSTNADLSTGGLMQHVIDIETALSANGDGQLEADYVVVEEDED